MQLLVVMAPFSIMLIAIVSDAFVKLVVIAFPIATASSYVISYCCTRVCNLQIITTIVILQL